jgi:hypothetical protein
MKRLAVILFVVSGAVMALVCFNRYPSPQAPSENLGDSSVIVGNGDDASGRNGNGSLSGAREAQSSSNGSSNQTREDHSKVQGAPSSSWSLTTT